MDKLLHVFSNDVTDWVIAYSPEDAVKVWEETTGETYDRLEGWGDFEQEADDKVSTMFETDTDNLPIPDKAIYVEEGEYSRTVKATNRAWADCRGRCFLGSTEY